MGIETRMPGHDNAARVDSRAEAAREVAKAADPARQAPDAVTPVTPDAVRLSADLQLADKAIQAAMPQDGLRPDAVARARALLQAGELGRDLPALADRLIDAITQTRDPRD
jgi:hypothetical protein